MKICDDKYCTGCGACVDVCPKSCIKFGFNSRFEIIPVINNEECIECGLCFKKCPINSEQNKYVSENCYASYSYSCRKTSSSGGIASSLSKYFIKNEGCVCGSIYDGTVHHIVTSDANIVDKMRGSKYVQSRIDKCYKELKLLCKTKKCLFIGTPCQVAAARNVVGNSENLYCVDLICHGTPSPKYLEEVIGEKKFCKSLSFRNKGEFAISIDGKISAIGERYMMSFLSGMVFRESCYECPFAEKRRLGDITIGDFWEIKNFDETSKGVSCVLINTIKGQKLIDYIKDDIYIEERSLDEAYAGNPQLTNPSSRHRYREKFVERLLKGYSFDQAVKPLIKKERLKNWLKKRAIVKWIINQKFKYKKE